MTRGRFRREEKNRDESLRLYAFTRRDRTVSCKASVSKEYMIDWKTMDLLGRETSSGENPFLTEQNLQSFRALNCNFSCREKIAVARKGL